MTLNLPNGGNPDEIIRPDGSSTSKVIGPDGKTVWVASQYEGIAGTRLYEAGNGQEKIYQYNVSTAFDISTATFDASIDTQDSSPQGLSWNDDGTRLYEIGLDQEKINQYNVSTAFDISTATFDTSIDTQDSLPQDLSWNDDGARLYETGNGQGKIYQYNVSTPFDITTATFDTSIDTQDDFPGRLSWNDDGARLYQTGNGQEKINQYNVSTAFDISTATFDTSIDTQDSSPQDLSWNDDGTRLYEIGLDQGKIYQYNVSTPFDISTATFDTSIDTQESVPAGLSWNGAAQYPNFNTVGDTAIPDSGVSRWQYEQDATDSWGSNALTLNGGPTYTTTSKVGSYALSFDGTDDEAVNTSFPDIGNQFTAMAWARPTDTLDNYNILFLNGNQGGDREFKFILQADGGGNLRANIGDGSTSANVGAYTPSVGTWVHLALTYDGSTLRFFTNGSQTASTSVSMTTYTTSEFYQGFGVSGDGTRKDHAPVILDDSRVYNSALSESEINDVYQNTRGSSGVTFPITVDDFERVNPLSDYNGSTVDYSVVQDETVSGNRSLYSDRDGGIYTRSLNTLPSQGDVFRFHVKMTGPNFVYIGWGIPENPTNTAAVYEGYQCYIKTGSGTFKIRKCDSGGNLTDLTSNASVTVNENEWYEIEVQWGTDGTMTMSLFDNSGTKLGGVTGTDTDYTDGGISWRNDGDPLWFDYFRLTGEI